MKIIQSVKDYFSGKSKPKRKMTDAELKAEQKRIRDTSHTNVNSRAKQIRDRKKRRQDMLKEMPK